MHESQFLWLVGSNDAGDTRLDYLAVDGYRAAIKAYLERLRELTDHAPHTAVHWAELVPLLIRNQPAAFAARALGIAATAHIAGGHIATGFAWLDRAAALTPPPSVMAELLGRRARGHILQEDWSRARQCLTQARKLATGVTEQKAILARLGIQEAVIRWKADEAPGDAARRCLHLLPHCPDDHSRQVAILTGASALATIAPRAAAAHLDTVYRWQPDCENPGRTDYLLALVDGRVRAQAGQDLRAARRRLIWAANGFLAGNMLYEATYAVCDLLTCAYRYTPRASTAAARTALSVIKQLRDASDTPATVRDACAAYLREPTPLLAGALRAAFLDERGDFLTRHS